MKKLSYMSISAIDGCSSFIPMDVAVADCTLLGVVKPKNSQYVIVDSSYQHFSKPPPKQIAMITLNVSAFY